MSAKKTRRAPAAQVRNSAEAVVSKAHVGTRSKKEPAWTRPDATGNCFITFGVKPETARILYERLDGKPVAPFVRASVLKELGIEEAQKVTTETAASPQG